MTRRQDLEEHRRSLCEIRDIMTSMKSLAYMETRKLRQLVDAQRAVVDSIEAVAADFVAFHADALPDAAETNRVYLLIGSERGLCRDFNPRLLSGLDAAPKTQASAEPILIAIGHKLHTLLENDRRVATRIEGASVTEEVFAVLQQIVQTLAELQEQHETLTVYGVHHRANGDVVSTRLLPPFQHHRDATPRYTHPPMLNLTPEAFIIGLTDHYLYAALHAMLYASLLAENQARVSHLEGAVRHLDHESERIAHRCHTLRQEEIIEEIEVILLSARSLQETGDGR